MGARPWLARTQVDYAAMLLDDPGSRDDARAARLLETAVATAGEFGLAVTGERARAMARRAGAAAVG